MTRKRLLTECPKCGARGKCDKHGMTATGIDLRQRMADTHIFTQTQKTC